MQMRYIALGLLVVFLILFLRGSSIATRCGQIGACQSCWQNIPASVSGPLCPDGKSCIADPKDQEHNAWVDVLLCACETAKASNYADSALNTQIQQTMKTVNGYDVTAQALCEQPGLLLTKREY